jgi:hypothetical protein
MMHLLAAVLLTTTITGTPSLTGDGAGFFGAWIDAGKVVAARLDAHGQVIGEPFTRAVVGSTGVKVASGGGMRLLLFDDGTKVYAIRFDAQGDALDAEPVALGDGVCGCAAAWDGARFFVVWRQGSSSDGFPAAFLGPSGEASSVDRVPTNGGVLLAYPVTLAWTGEGFRLYWAKIRWSSSPFPHHSTTDWNYTAISAAGVAGRSATPIPEDDSPHAFAQRGAEGISLVAAYGVAIYRFEESPPSHRFRWLAPVGVLNITTDASGFLAVWNYAYGSVSRLALARLDDAGELTFLETGAVPPLYSVAVAVDGTDAPLVLARTTDKRLLAIGRDDLLPAPAPPSAPIIRDVVGLPPRYDVTWDDTSDNEEGFFLDSAELPANSTRTAINTISKAPNVFIWAWNAAGAVMSNTVTGHPPPRRRPR